MLLLTHPLSLLSLFSLLLVLVLVLAHAKFNLERPDHDALSIIQKDLGFNSQPNIQSPCHSPGVFCEWRISNDSYSLRVTRIFLNSHQLTGFLSPVIGRLSDLKELALQNNHLVDQIPHQIVDCRKLEILNLHNNQFSGHVPMALSSLVRLRILDLSYNKFSGNLDFLKYFPNLETLSLENNMFSGKVPASLRSFRNLRLFNVSGNSFIEGSALEMKQVEYSLAESIEETPIRNRYVLAENSASLIQVAPSPSPMN